MGGGGWGGGRGKGAYVPLKGVLLVRVHWR